MAKYHKYVFDIETRKFIGNFEEMYQRESVDNFDFILDLGCGKRFAYSYF